METNLIIKGGEKELDLFFKAEAYYCSVLAKMWEVKENEDKIDMLLRHSEEFPFPRMNKREKTTYSIDELISSMEKYDPNKKYINISKEQDFLSAYENYKNEKKQNPMETNHQKLTELTDKFNKRLDVIISANPNESFVVEDREKSEEMLKNKLHRLRGSNLPLQNQAVEYLQQNILELREEERSLEIAQGKEQVTLFISQEPVDNLLAIFQKLAERKQELQQAQQQKIEPLRIQQVKEITKDRTSIIDYDIQGNKVHIKHSNGYEVWLKYDKQGNLVHTKDSNGEEESREYLYNEQGNKIYTKDSNGNEIWYQYNENGNLIHTKNSDGDEIWREYDKNGNQIHLKNSNGYEEWYEYDESGNQIYKKDSNGKESWYEYDKNSNLIHTKNTNGYEEWYQFDEHNNQIHYKNSDRYEEKREITYYPNEINIQKTMAENNEIKSIAEKSLSDSNYLFLFDEKKREEVQNYLVGIAESQNYLTRKPLTAEDYLAISDKLAKEMSSSSPMTKGMTITEISEKSTLYYQKYENALKKEQEILKNQNMEQSTEINKEVKTEQPIQPPAVDYTKKWAEYKFDTTQPLIAQDIYAFLNKGGDPNTISLKISELLEKKVEIPRYIKKQELWDNIVKPFRELPQQKQTELKNFMQYSLEQIPVETQSQKLEKLIKFYTEEFAISPNKKFTHNDVLAFCYQYGKDSISKLKEIAEKFLEHPVDLKGKSKNEIIEKIVTPIVSKESEELTIEFKKELLSTLESQKIQKEQQPRKEYSKEEFEKFYVEHLEKLNPEKGLTETNIYAILNLKLDEHTKAVRQEMLERYLNTPFEEIIKLKKNQMIQKVNEIKGNENEELQNDFKREIQKVFLLSKSILNKNNSEDYENQLKELEYPEKGVWKIAHIDKLLTQQENLEKVVASTSLENDSRLMSILAVFESEDKEFLIHSSSFHIGEEQILAKQYLLNAINHSQDRNEIKEQLFQNLQESQQESYQIKR